MSTPLTLSYPSKLDTYEQPHSVWFTIYSRQLSRTAGAVGAGAGDDRRYTSDNRISIEQGAIKNISNIAAGTAGVVGTAKKAGGSVLGAVAAGVGATVVGEVVDTFFGEGTVSGIIEDATDVGSKFGELVEKYAGGTNAVYRTDQIIRLHIPQSPQEQYNAGWSEVEFGLMGKYANGGSLVDDLKGLANLGDANASKERALRYIAGVSNIANAAGFNFKLQDMIELQTGKITNPYKEQLFKTMNFRTFAYQYKFAPKNPTELSEVFRIINMFRIHMHPERMDDGFFIMYPSEFSIQYYYKDKENEWLAKIANCALIDMKVDYGSGGTFTTFQLQEGAPTEITLTLQFKELELLDRKWFEDWNPPGTVEDGIDNVPANTGDETLALNTTSQGNIGGTPDYLNIGLA